MVTGVQTCALPISLLVALLLLPAMLLETPLPAFADPVSEEAAPSETDELSEGIGTVYLIVVPNLTWSDITNDQRHRRQG